MSAAPTTLHISTSAITIYYHQFGNPAGTPVFLLHGFPDSPAAWLPVIDRLDTAKLRLIVPYLRGVGPTEVLLPEYLSGEVAALASDLLTLADALGIERFHVAGHDWGARTAYAAAVLAPKRVRGLLALASPYLMFGGKTLPPAQAEAYWYQWYFNTQPGVEAFSADPIPFCRHLWHVWAPTWKFSKSEFTEAAASFKNPQFVPVVLHSYRSRYKTDPGLPPYQLTAEILEPRPKISVPTSYVHGTDDGCVLPEAPTAQKSWFTGPYETTLLKGVGHFPHRENPKAVAKLLTRLLKQTR